MCQIVFTRRAKERACTVVRVWLPWTNDATSGHFPPFVRRSHKIQFWSHRRFTSLIRKINQRQEQNIRRRKKRTDHGGDRRQIRYAVSL